MDTTLNNLMLMGKYGLSSGVACCTDAGTEFRYFMFGENNFITRAHTRSFKRKLNSGCYIKETKFLIQVGLLK